MTISDLTKSRPEENENPQGQESTVPPGEYPRTGGRRLTAIVVVWLLVVVSAAAFIFYRSQSDESFTPTAGTALASQLYVDPNSQAASWVKANPGTPEAELIEQRIAEQPAGKWFGAWNRDITQEVDQYTSGAAEAGQVPVLVAYNLPGRDCGGESAGGARNAEAYNKWIDGFAAGLDDRRAIVVLEPDSLAMLDDCLGPARQQERLDLLAGAVDKLQSDNVWVYLDAGHSNWVPAGEMADRLTSAGIEKAHGFSLNVSNYNVTDDEVAYGKTVQEELGTEKPFVVDTSRNGNGSKDGEWCNPTGTKIGPEPQAGGGAEMFLWLKVPGESDGNCGAGGGTEAGQFSPELAQRLIKGE